MFFEFFVIGLCFGALFQILLVVHLLYDDASAY